MEARGQLSRQRSSRSYASIVRANTLNIPNGILFFFGLLTLTFGSWQDALFLGILVSNIAIGSFQEIRSKRALDKRLPGRAGGSGRSGRSRSAGAR